MWIRYGVLGIVKLFQYVPLIIYTRQYQQTYRKKIPNLFEAHTYNFISMFKGLSITSYHKNQKVDTKQTLNIQHSSNN